MADASFPAVKPRFLTVYDAAGRLRPRKVLNTNSAFRVTDESGLFETQALALEKRSGFRKKTFGNRSFFLDRISSENGGKPGINQTIPCAIMASATFRKPAIFAPTT